MPRHRSWFYRHFTHPLEKTNKKLFHYPKPSAKQKRRTKKFFAPIKKRYTGRRGLHHIYKDVKTAEKIAYQGYKGYRRKGVRGAVFGVGRGIEQAESSYRHNPKGTTYGSKKYYKPKGTTYGSRKYYKPKGTTYGSNRYYKPKGTTYGSYRRRPDNINIYMD
jgi:hypothetical protein